MSPQRTLALLIFSTVIFTTGMVLVFLGVTVPGIVLLVIGGALDVVAVTIHMRLQMQNAAAISDAEDAAEARRTEQLARARERDGA